MLYTVKRGDTLHAVAERYGTSASALSTANQMPDPAKLVVGQSLVIPTPASPQRSIAVNGYAFPNIGEAALTGALPYLTYLSVFACRVQTDGSLVDINDDALIRRAYVGGAAPLMVITNQRPSGGFSSDIARAVLSDETAKRALIKNVMLRLDEKSYYGLNVDFEYIYPEDRELYTAFLRELNERLKRVGYLLSVALAPKISASQSGLLYSAHDYAAIGEIADYAILMTYEWGYTYGPPMAVAPLDRVEQVLQYAVSAMPPEKILMGMPNYGYNWQLPYRQGTAARSISLAEAPVLAFAQYAEIRRDEKSAAPFFEYYDSTGAEHVVWFDDPQSIAARLALIDKYDLGGASYWNINTLYRPNWQVLGSMYNIDKAFS